MKLQIAICLLSAATLFGCAHPEDDSFGIQAAKRHESCSGIATGSAMDAYAHGGPTEQTYDDVKRDCQEFYRRQKEGTRVPEATPPSRP